MDFMAEQKKLNEANKELSKNILEESFVRTFYNDALKSAYDSYLRNRENPVNFDVEANAYMNGVSTDIPEQDKEGVLKPILEVNKSLREDTLKRFNENALEKAEENSNLSRIGAGYFATQAFKDFLPNDAQLQIDANYYDDINLDVKNRKLTPKQGVELKEIHEANRFTYAFERVIRNPDISYEDKEVLIDLVLQGKTGNPFIDNMPDYRRLELLTNVTNKNKQIDEYEEHLQKKGKVEEKNNWERGLLNLYNYANADGNPRYIEEMADYLKATAPSKEDYDRVDNVYSIMEGKTNPKIKLELDNALNSGALNKQQKLDLVYKSRDFLSTADYQKTIDNINNPVSVEMERQDIKIALAEAKAKYGYTPLGSNDAYDWFNYALQRNLAVADTPEKRLNAVQKAFDETDKMFADRVISAYGVEAKRKFIEKYQRYGLTPEKIVSDIDSETISLAKQETKRKVVRMSEAEAYKNQAKANVIHDVMIQNNLTYQDATLIVEEAQKIENMGK